MSVVGSARPILSKLDVGDGQSRTYTSTYEVITDDKTDTPALVMTASGLPAFGSRYTWYNGFDDWAFVTRATATPREPSKSGLLWSVVVTHETPKHDQKRGSTSGHYSQGRQNPINEPWEIQMGYAQFTRPVIKDRNGAPLQNTTQEAYIPAIEIDDSRARIVLTKNMSNVSIGNWVSSRDCVNSAPMWGLLKRQIKLTQWTPNVVYWGQGNAYVHNTFEFDVSFEKDDAGTVVGWTHVILNEGFRHLVNSAETNVLKRFAVAEDFRGLPSHKPILLKESGVKLESGGTPFYRKWEIYREFDFTLLHIPDPLPFGGVLLP